MSQFSINSEEIILRDIPLGKGGEGNVFEIISPSTYQDYVVKIYHPRERNRRKEMKINYMIENQPENAFERGLIWPKALVYEKGEFAGYLMRKAVEHVDLTSLASTQESKRINYSFLQQYSRETKEGFLNRLEICREIALSVNYLHQEGKYVITDLKPENITISLDGGIYLLDLDSIEIIKDNELLFPAEKLTGEYSPAEIENLDFRKTLIPESWDRFSLGVVIYKVLFGLHPFTGSCSYPFENLVTNEHKIKAGLFPLGSGKQYFKIIPEPHQNFYALPDNIRQLFIRCFEQGFQDPEIRPTPLEWANSLSYIQPDWKKYLWVTDEAATVAETTTSLKTNKERGIRMRSTNGYWFSLSAISLVTVFAVYSAVNTPVEKPYEFIESAESKYMSVEPYFHYVEGRALVKSLNDEKYGFLDENKDAIIPPIYEVANNFDQGQAYVVLNGKAGYIDRFGKQVIPCQYKSLKFFSEGLAGAFLEEKGWGFIDFNGNVIIPYGYQYVHSFSEGLAAVESLGYWGFINKEGKEIIPIRFDRVSSFHQGIASAKVNNLWGFINKQGNWIIEPQFDKIVDEFKDGKARVTKDRDIFYIDRRGNVIDN